MFATSEAEAEMEETPEKYTQRILGYVEGQQPLDVLAATADKGGSPDQGCVYDGIMQEARSGKMVRK